MRKRILAWGLAAVFVLPAAAWAAKEKFVRDKPHVNIGTVMVLCPVLVDAAGFASLGEPSVEQSSNLPDLGLAARDGCSEVVAKLRSLGAECDTDATADHVVVSCAFRSPESPGD